jgi:transposase
VSEQVHPGQAKVFAQRLHVLDETVTAVGGGVLGRRGPVERSLAWLVGYRRLQIRYERRADILLGFLHLACALVCLRSLNRPRV